MFNEDFLSLSLTDTFVATAQRFETHGPTHEEKLTFSNGILLSMSNGIGVSGDSDSHFEENLSKVAESVVAIDQMFDEIDDTFLHLARGAYPELRIYYDEWERLRMRWRALLNVSATVADHAIKVLNRFESVYLYKVEIIQTERDRFDAIDALGEFISEEQDLSVETSKNFLDLKRDMVYFLERVDQWSSDNGWVPSLFALMYKGRIDSCRYEIARLTGLINSAKGQLAIAGSSFYFFDLKNPAVSIIIFTYQAQLQEQEEVLRGTQKDLACVEQGPIMQLKSKMDSWRPDLELVCERLRLFAEIWSSVRSQAVQFREHIHGGLDAATNMRFKREVRLARLVCTPLLQGLRGYVDSIEAHSGSLFHQTIPDFATIGETKILQICSES